MHLRFLGTGDAGGVPRYGCSCDACTAARCDPTKRRKSCSALVTTSETQLLLDAGLTDLGERFPPGRLSAIVLTHFHPDHVQGLFHLRWGLAEALKVYAPPDSEGCADLYKHPGMLSFTSLTAFEPFVIGDLTITPLPLNHSKLTFGYAITDGEGARVAYLTDTAGLPSATAVFLREWQAHGLAIDCSFPPREVPSQHHNDWTQALSIIDEVRPSRAWLTHIGHGMDNWYLTSQPDLPGHIQLAQDDRLIDFSKVACP